MRLVRNQGKLGLQCEIISEKMEREEGKEGDREGGGNEGREGRKKEGKGRK